MRSPIVALVVAAAIGAFVGSANAQQNPKALAGPPAGDHKEMPAADSPAAKVAVAPATSNAAAKVGKEAVVKPGVTTHAKSFKQ
jgi:hypothetical protein